MKKYLLIPLLLTVVFCFAQESKLYDRKGRLIADTNFHISKKQLKKLISIEKLLSDSFLKFARYNPILRENEVLTQVLLSFKVDNQCDYSEIQIVKLKIDTISPKNWIPMIQMTLKADFLRATNSFGKQLSAHKGKKDIYYIPISFEIGDESCDKIESGWLIKIIKLNNTAVAHPVYSH